MSIPVLTSVLLAHRYEVVRAGVRRMLSQSSTTELLADVASGPQAIDYARTLEPDVVILDEHLPHISCADTARIIGQEVPSSRLLLWAETATSEAIRSATQAGFHGVITPDVSSTELVSLIVAAARREPAISAAGHALIAQVGTAPVESASPVGFTPREREIVRMVVHGFTSQQIGKELFISSRTVETHRARIMDKIGVKKTAAMVRFALDHPTLFELTNTAP